ncbi:MAG: CatB-related O-acetyltransferase [Verrucomicrobiae bacterium]|nr:CatB-related O-acetyltransferase [Verrucomicrobiae bacterium]
MNEGRKTPVFSSLALRLYPRLGVESIRGALRQLALTLEGGPARSLTLREIFRRFHRVEVGLHTAGPCRLHPKVFHVGTAFGRYVSVASTVRTFTRNHTIYTKSTSGFFDNPAAGIVKSDLVSWGRLVIGHGAWLGHQAILLPPAERIGEGAIVTAGSVVYTNVPPYAIVSGFPARVIGYRYPKPVIEELLASRWWELSPSRLAAQADRFRTLLSTQPDAPAHPIPAPPSHPSSP